MPLKVAVGGSPATFMNDLIHEMCRRQNLKIIWTDNFNNETVADRLVASGIKHRAEGEAMLKGLRDTCTESGPNWYNLVEDDYRLSRGMEDLV